MQTLKILVNCQDGTNNIERATISFILAVTASKNHPTAIFVSADASYLMLRGNMDNLKAEGYEPIYNLYQQFINNGGQIWLCPACVKAKGFTESDLIDGVEIAGAPKSIAWLQDGGMLLA